MKQTIGEMVRNQGFKSFEEYTTLTRKIDRNNLNMMRAFKQWQSKMGSKGELKEIIKRHGSKKETKRVSTAGEDGRRRQSVDQEEYPVEKKEENIVYVVLSDGEKLIGIPLFEIFDVQELNHFNLPLDEIRLSIENDNVTISMGDHIYESLGRDIYCSAAPVEEIKKLSKSNMTRDESVKYLQFILVQALFIKGEKLFRGGIEKYLSNKYEFKAIGAVIVSQ